MADSPKMTVYIKPGCPWCVDAEAWLKREGYEYEVIDVIADREQYTKMQQLSGQSSAPTMTYGDLLLADFGVDELEEFIEKHEISP